MVVDPNILKNIRKVVFKRIEPHDTKVLWGNGEAGHFIFYLFWDGKWHPLDDITNITISEISGDISIFNFMW